TEPENALRRAVADRGLIWFERHAGDKVTASNYEEQLLALAALSSKRENLRRRLLEEGGWSPYDIDSGKSRQEVLGMALTALGLET
ncbi:MAG: hypothetical protein ABI970_11170, partial [Chloroflexota bacterium]